MALRESMLVQNDRVEFSAVQTEVIHLLWNRREEAVQITQNNRENEYDLFLTAEGRWSLRRDHQQQNLVSHPRMYDVVGAYASIADEEYKKLLETATRSSMGTRSEKYLKLHFNRLRCDFINEMQRALRKLKS